MTNQTQITKCQAPDYTQYSEAYIKRNPQLYCEICHRWQYKKLRCKLFVAGAPYYENW